MFSSQLGSPGLSLTTNCTWHLFFAVTSWPSCSCRKFFSAAMSVDSRRPSKAEEEPSKAEEDSNEVEPTGAARS